MSEAMSETRKKYCTSCGTQHEAEAQFCSGCGNSFDATKPASKARWKSWLQVLLVAVMGVVLVKAFKGQTGDRSETAPNVQKRFDGQKTVSTFIDCKVMWDFSVKPPDAELVQQKRFDEYISEAVAHSVHNRNVASRLRQMDVVRVDPEISTFVLESAEMFDLFAGFSDQKKVFVERLKEHMDEFASWGAMLESFARGFIGDPFGKSREALQGQERLKVMWEELKTTEEKVRETAVLMDQKAARLKVYLQTTYGANFSKEPL